MGKLKEVHVAILERAGQVVLEHDDVRVVNAAVGMLDGNKGCYRQGSVANVDIRVCRERG